jgi:3-deoxy-D-manno-octulosonic-acid transferase
LVFVGKSLPPNEGGQTPIEAALLEKPLMFGPAMSNFRPWWRRFWAAARRCAWPTKSSWSTRAGVVARREASRGDVAAAHDWHKANQGSMERTLRELDGYLTAR